MDERVAAGWEQRVEGGRKESLASLQVTFVSRHRAKSFRATSYGAPCKTGDAVVSRGHSGWVGQLRRVDVRTCARTAHNGLPQKIERERETGRGSLLDRPSCPSDDPLGQRVEPN